MQLKSSIDKNRNLLFFRGCSSYTQMLKVQDHQVAGHKAGNEKLAPLIDDSGHFYKPHQGDEHGSNEASFYASFSSDTRIPGHICRFFLNFYGTQLRL